MLALLLSAVLLAASPTPVDWAVGTSGGIGARDLPAGTVPDGWAPRLELGAVAVQRRLSFPWAPDRLELQVDWLHLLVQRAWVRTPRLPVTALGTWTNAGRRVQWTGSLGLHTEWGLDRTLKGEQLRLRPGLTVAPTGALGLERSRLCCGQATVGWQLWGALGLSLGGDGPSATADRFTALGLRRTWWWGW